MKFFGTLDRYLMKQFLIAYVIVSSALLALFVVIEGIGKIDDFLKVDGNVIVVAIKYFTARIPLMFVNYLSPVFTLMAGIFTITTLNKGSELTPMRGSGLSIQRILMPFFALALVIALMTMILQNVVVPASKQLIREAMYTGKDESLEKVPIFQDHLGRTITVSRYYPQRKHGVGVLVHSELETITARSMTYMDPGDGEQAGYWTLHDSHLQRRTEDGIPTPVNPGATGSDRFSLREKNRVFATDLRPVDLELGATEFPYLSYGELKEQFQRRPNGVHLHVTLHKRISFPLASVVLLLLGLPIVLRTEQRSVLLGVVISILVSTIYLLAMVFLEDLGNKSMIPPALAAWLPVLLFGTLGVTLFTELE